MNIATWPSLYHDGHAIYDSLFLLTEFWIKMNRGRARIQPRRFIPNDSYLGIVQWLTYMLNIQPRQFLLTARSHILPRR